LAGATAVHVPLSLPDFRIDWQRLTDSLNQQTRLVIVNSPHNPTGSVLSWDDLEQLAATLAPFDCAVLSDEVYEHIVFDGARHTSLLEIPGLAERGLAISSFGKTYHATGWKTGYATGPGSLTAELRRVHQFCTFASTTPTQYAIADYLVENPNHSLELPHFYREKRDHFLAAMAGSPFDFKPAAGTYFQLADYSEVSRLDDVEFSRRLTIDHGVATIPISVFCQAPPASRLIRFCFAKQLATLDEAARRLTGLVRVES
jgi:methionine aminotransferase